MNPGLYYKIDQLTEQLSHAQERMAEEGVTPRDRDVYQSTAEGILRDLLATREAVATNESLRTQTESLLADLIRCGTNSRHRSLARTHLEDAIMRLTYELGHKPN